MIETVQELTPESRGRWLVHHRGGSRTIWILDHNRTEFMRQPGTGAAMPGDGVLYGIRHILAWPKVGYHSRVELRNGTRHTATEVTAIRPLVLPDDIQGTAV